MRRVLPLASAACALLLVLLVSPASADLAPGAWFPKGGQAGALFGSSVAPAGDVNRDGYGDVLVGAPGFDNGQADEGRAFLYLGSASGLASSPFWTWEPNQALARAGTAVAPAGDINGDGYADVLVGVPYWNGPGGSACGGVFVFLGSALGLPATASDTLSSGGAGSHFGLSLSTAGDVNGDQYADVIVGAPDLANGLSGEGAVFVYLGSPGGLQFAPNFSLEGEELNAHLGLSVSGAGDVNGDGFADVLMGAPGAQFALYQGAGKALLYRGSGSGIGAILSTINGGADSTATGTSVANAGDMNGDGYADVVIGSPGWTDFGQTHGGHVDFYSGSSTGISAPVLTVTGFLVGERAGSAVVTAGDIDGDGYADALIDRRHYPQFPPATTPEIGSVLVVLGAKDGPAIRDGLYGTNLDVAFAAALATTGDANGDGFSEVLVGAPTYSGASGTNEGAVFSYDGSARPPGPAPNSPLIASGPGTAYGCALAILPHPETGEFPALLIGEVVYGASQTGRAELRPGQWDGVSFATHTYNGTGSTENFGARVADAGDVNRDTFSDFLISSPGFTGVGEGARGKVTLYLGDTNGPTASPWVAEGDQLIERYGSTIAGRGDVNRDGYQDVLVGTPYWDSPTAQDCGKVWFYPGGPSGLGAATWSRSGTVAGEQFGMNVAMVGDLDADGYSDIAIGAETSLSGNARVEVYFGGASGPSPTPDWTLVASPPRASFSSPFAAGDINGDGVGDLLVAASHDPDGKGAVFAYLGNRGRAQPPVSPWWKYEGQVGAYAGDGVGAGGDLNGDGIADIVVGESGYANGQAGEGRFSVFYGRKGQPPAGPVVSIESNLQFANLGAAVAPLADLNNDGRADAVVGAIGGTGQVWVYFGGGGGPPKFLKENESHFGGIFRFPPALLDNQTEFGLNHSLRSPAGRDRVAGELEVQLQGDPFTGHANRNVITYSDTGAPGAQGSATTYQYYAPAPYKATGNRWRGRTYTRSPYFQRSHWSSVEARVSGEYDFLTGGTVTGVPDGVSEVARIERVLPNPSSAQSTVSFTLPARAVGRLDAYDVSGRHVRTVAHEEFPAGANASTWDGKDDLGHAVAAGIYFLELRVGNMVDRSRIVRLR